MILRVADLEGNKNMDSFWMPKDHRSATEEIHMSNTQKTGSNPCCDGTGFVDHHILRRASTEGNMNNPNTAY